MSAGNIYSRTACGPFIFLESSYPPGYQFPTHVDREPRVSIVISGMVKEDSKGDEEFGSSASVVVKPGTALHSNTFGPQGATLLSIAFPDESILDKHTISQWKWYHGGQISREAMHLVQAFKRPEKDDATIEEHTLLLLSTLSKDVYPEPSSSSPPRWLLQVRDQLHDEYAACYSVRDLAGSVDVHPVYLTRLFHRYFGCSVSRYVQQIRVHQAANDLASSDMQLTQIALEAGFSDQSHLCHTFKKKYGLTPGAFRSLAKSFKTTRA